ncbi:MAG: ABC transporter ATP-binding protein [Nitrospiraceae bacterium]
MAEVVLGGVSKRVGTVEVIASLTLTVREGEFFCIVGPSGSGKSTLLHLIAGLEAPTAGQILFDGQDVTMLPPRDRDVALVFQSYALYPHMTVAENLAFPLRVARKRVRMDRGEVEHEIQRVASILGLDRLLSRRPKELSGGQRQRVALGRALIRKPRVFLLDEPLSNLDPQLRSGMRAELRRLHDELGITMLYVTHDQTEATTLADRLAVLDRGRLQQVGSPQDLYDEPCNLFVAGFIGQPAMNLIEARLEDGYVVAGPLRLPVPAELAGRDEKSAVRIGIRPESVRVLAPKAERQHALEGIVRLIEPVGGRTWVTVEVVLGADKTSIVGVADEEFRPRSGEPACVFVQRACPHVFDSRTGVRLGYRMTGTE